MNSSQGSALLLIAILTWIFTEPIYTTSLATCDCGNDDCLTEADIQQFNWYREIYCFLASPDGCCYPAWPGEEIAGSSLASAANQTPVFSQTPAFNQTPAPNIQSPSAQPTPSASYANLIPSANLMPSANLTPSSNKTPFANLVTPANLIPSSNKTPSANLMPSANLTPSANKRAGR